MRWQWRMGSLRVRQVDANLDRAGEAVNASRRRVFRRAGRPRYTDCVSALRSFRWPALAGYAGLALLFSACTAFADAESTARAFLKRVQAGDIAGAKRLLEAAQWRSQPRGGDDAYFVYESGQEPNLAFLVGRLFDVGPMSTRESHSEWYPIDGSLYAQVTIPLSFRPERYAPYLLPPPMAFGRRMSFVAFMNFVAAPDRTRGEFSEFTLRLRPGVESGSIRPLGPRVAAPPPPQAPPGAQSVSPSPEMRREMFGSLGMPVPQDPAAVLLPSGEALTPEQLKRFLPRLRAITLELRLSRRGRLGSFGVSGFQFTDAVLVTDRGEVRVDGTK